jgi:hypothetical protein
MSAEPVSIDALARSLNGFDEIAISKAFGYEVEDMLGPNGDGKGAKKVKFLRALIFVSFRRDGMKDREAYNATMNIPLVELEAQFGDLTEDPSNASGK